MLSMYIYIYKSIHTITTKVLTPPINTVKITAYWLNMNGVQAHNGIIAIVNIILKGGIAFFRLYLYMYGGVTGDGGGEVEGGGERV